MKRFIVFSGKRHPREHGAADVTAFLNHLVLERRVAAATQNQALAALLNLPRANVHAACGVSLRMHRRRC